MIVKVLCHFPKGYLMFASENIQTANRVYTEENNPGSDFDVSGKIIVTSPGGAGSYLTGDTVVVAWQTTGITGTLTVSLVKTDGSGAYTVAEDLPYDDPPFNYTIPQDLEPAEYRLKIEQGTYYGCSDPFRVNPPGNWRNRIISISSLSRNIGEDKSYEISGISIEFNDTDRYFRNMMSGTYRYIAGKTVEIFTESDQLIYTGTVEKWQFSEDAFVLFINDKLSGLDTIIAKVIAVEDFPNMAEEAEGGTMPIIYGEIATSTGAVKCWRVDTQTVEEGGQPYEKGVYLLARHHCKSLDGVFDKDGNALTTGDFTLDNQGTTGEEDEIAFINYTKTESSFTDDVIRVNVSGKMNGASDLIDDPVDALKDLIREYSPMKVNAAGMEEAKVAMQARGYKIAAVIYKQQSLKDVLVDYCFSFDCDFYIGKGNEVIVTLLNWSALEPQKSLIKSQIVDFQLDELPEEIRNKVMYMYQYNYADETFLKSPVYSKESSILNWGEFYQRNEPLELRYMADPDSASDIVQRYLIQRKNPKRVAQIDIPLSEFVGLDISDIIEIKHPGAIDILRRKYQIRRVNIDFVTDIVQVEALDITSMTGGTFVLGNTDELAGTWEESEGSERNYGYLADRVSGYFGNNIDYGKVLY